MNTKFLIDIGSSTVKVYAYSNNILDSVEQKTFRFKENFSKENGLSKENKRNLIEYFQKLIDKYNLNNKNTKIFATGIFRELIDIPHHVQEFFEYTGLYFNIITHDLEAFYLKQAWINSNSASLDKMIVINIGGKTTEILLCEKGKLITEPLKLTLGVGSINTEFASLNNAISGYDYNEIIGGLTRKIEKQIKKPSAKFNVAIHTGGELNYMKIAGYNLLPNILFEDASHPLMIAKAQYTTRNVEIFSKVSLDELKSMMPKNPNWMEGARACSALADAICNYFGVDYIVPSDSNLIDGVISCEAEKVVLCGSFNKHLSQIAALMTLLKKRGIQILSPSSTEVTDVEGDFVVFKNDVVENHNTWAVEELHLKAIDKSDFVIACNFENYIGVSTTFELEHAYRKGKKIVFIQDNEIADIFGYRIGVPNMACEIGLIKN